MQRHCDGTDPNLTREDFYNELVPCDCGNTFDDVNHSTIFPHGFIPSQEVRQRWVDEALA